MADSFSEISQEVANDFIKTVLLADDEIFQEDFNAKKLVSSFAANKKACSILKFDSPEDYETIIRMDSITDVTVLDWKIHEDNHVDKETNSDEEEDVQEIEIRGRHTKPVIEKIVSNALDLNQLKLIIVYTTEDGLSGIITSIEKYLKEKNFGFNREDDFSLHLNTIRISVLGKENLKNKGLPDISDRAFSYDELPKAISKEFSFLTNGIISNTLLKSITVIRENTFQLLGIFSPMLDSAFVAHRAMLPYPDTAGELLISTIVDNFSAALLDSNISDCFNTTAVNGWIDNQNFKAGSHKFKFSNKELNIEPSQLKMWQSLGYKEFFKVEYKSQQDVDTGYDKLEDVDKYQLKVAASKLFTPEGIEDNVHEDFAILTHHKSNMCKLPKCPPMLSLGSVVSKFSSYYLCIQQPCDSIRIESLEHRRFLFLNLEKVDKNYSIIFKDDNKATKLKVCNNSFNLSTYIFRRSSNGGVLARKLNSGYYFYDYRNEKFKWILDLKKSHAQKIANEFSAKLSRVGLDESEWLRRSNNG